jgi:uncharacterized protein YndB with AHSA1/START domain
MKPPRSSSSCREFAIELEIAADRDAVWRALSDRAELVRWFPPQAEVEPRPGGEIVWRWGDLHRWPQRVEAWDPGAHLRTRYDSVVPDGDGGLHPLFIDFFLIGEGGRTTLRLVHSGFGPDSAFDQEYDGISSGWPVELRSLRLYLERHAGRDRQLAWCVRPIDVDHGEAWRRLVGPGGFACDQQPDGLAEGEAFRMNASTGDVFEGAALTAQRHHFCGIASSHGDGFLRIAVESCSGSSQVWLWLATYGRPAGEAAALQGRWQDMLSELFATRGETARATGE